MVARTLRTGWEKSVTDEDTTTSVNEIRASQKLEIYPNPAKEYINILLPEISTSDKPVVITVFNAEGKMVLNQKLSITDNYLEKLINISSLTEGGYFLMLQTNDKILFSRFVVQ